MATYPGRGPPTRDRSSGPVPPVASVRLATQECRNIQVIHTVFCAHCTREPSALRHSMCAYLWTGTHRLWLWLLRGRGALHRTIDRAGMASHGACATSAAALCSTDGVRIVDDGSRRLLLHLTNFPQSGSDHGNANLFAHFRVDNGADNHCGIVGCKLRNGVTHF